eukprot:10428112-Ditylum_brightwellii.AAC.1
MKGQDMMDFLPLHLGAIKRSGRVLNWVWQWTNSPHLKPLTPEDWYRKGHGINGGSLNSEGMWIPMLMEARLLLWVPPPAAADAVLEELIKSCHKREDMCHIFLCPWIFTQAWQKQ